MKLIVFTEKYYLSIRELFRSWTKDKKKEMNLVLIL